MNAPLPTHIGGYQHLEPFVVIEEGDILVKYGKPFANCYHTIGLKVGDIEQHGQYNVYRKSPVAKQADAHEREFGAAQSIAALAKAGISTGPAMLRGSCGPDVGPGSSCTLTLPSDAAERKRIPIYSGFLKYFPRACAEVARVSLAGNDQHNPGKPLHWDRSKSCDELDALSRHLLEAGTFDKDGIRHSAKLAWRGMANLEKELEAAEAKKE